MLMLAFDGIHMANLSNIGLLSNKTQKVDGLGALNGQT